MSARSLPVLDLEAQLGPLGAEIAAMLRPVLAPLVEKWEWVCGDDEQVHETASSWRRMARAVAEVAADEQAAVQRVAGEWEGLAQQSFTQAVTEVVRDLEHVAVRVEDVADVLDDAAEAVRRVERIVRELIRGLIEWAAISLAVSAAGAIVTLGASAAAGAAAAAAKAGIVGARIAAQLGQLAVELRRIQLVLGAYEAWVKSLTFAQRRLVSVVQGIVVKDLTPLDADWAQPTLDLAQIHVSPERCFDQDAEGPRW